MKHKTLLLTLYLLWLTLTGSYTGWQHPPLVITNIIITTIITAYLITQKPKTDLITIAILTIITTNLITATLTHQWNYQANQTLTWFIILTLYQLKIDKNTISIAAQITLMVYLPLSIIPGWQNTNVNAMNLITLTILAIPAMPPILLIAQTTATILITITLSSAGGLIALIAAGTTYLITQKHNPLITIPITPALIWTGWNWSGQSSIAHRLTFWAHALNNFNQKPTTGTGQYIHNNYIHAHNTILTTLATNGIPGLTALIFLIYAIIKRWPTLPTHTTALLTALATWSLVDEPLRFWGPAATFALALSQETTT